ncbi:MAG: sortase [Patescibacteria group bacterium]|nr:sortase [Patescibacteria group bacterium]
MAYTKNFFRSNAASFIFSVVATFTFYCGYQVLKDIRHTHVFEKMDKQEHDSFVNGSFQHATSTKTKQPPTSIYIPKIQKRHPIQASIVKDNQWQLFDTSVAWLSTSAVPGEGNVILYAHNWKNLWGDLYKLRPGDIIEVDQNGMLHTYVVTESRAVSKHDVEAILSHENRLTLYTCEGAFDQKRRVVYAVPQR